LKVLHVTYRFGEEIIGGAEHYLWNLSAELAKLGVDVTIATTTAGRLREPTRWNVFWEKGYPPGETEASGLRILRFPFHNLPKWLAKLYGIPLQRCFDREQWEIPPPLFEAEFGGVLGRGWYFEEQIGSLVQRWIGKKAEIFIRDENITEIGFTTQSPWNNVAQVFCNNEKIGEFSPSAELKYYEFSLPEPTSKARIEIVLKRTKRPLRDLRKLGMIFTDIVYKTGDEVKKVPLHRHYINELYSDPEALFNWLEKRANARPEKFGRYFDRCRGPLSPSLEKFLKNHARDFDLILGHNFPFPISCKAVSAGNQAGVPTALLPLAHLEDDYYHWKHYYNALKTADITFSLSDFSKDIFRSRFEANAHTLGGGIDTEEFAKKEFHGDRFRKEHNLTGIPMILFVGRKSYPKRYNALIRAVRIVNQTRPCKLVMIGPDENGQPVDPKDALYLGKQERGAILDAYDACDVFAMLSASESFGIVFTEAWMREKPVIGYKHCGAIASLIDHGENGFLCETEQEAAGKILRLLDDPVLCKRLGASGKQKTLSRFTWKKIAEKAKTHYEEIIEKKKSSTR